MSHIAFDEAYMGAGNPLKGSRVPGFGAGNRTASTSRVERNRPKAKRPVKAAPKGLSRASVVVTRLDPRTFEVRVKGTRELVGMVRKISGAGGTAYSYRINRKDERAHKGFSTQKAAVARMLEKC